MKLLIVDDDEDILSDISDAFKISGFLCYTTPNPMNAIEIYKKENFDVVITDIRMPGMSGIELLKQIRSYDNRAKIIIITAYGDLETAISAINNRAYAFFGKPIDFSELIKTLRNIENENNMIPDITEDYQKLRDENDKLRETYEGLLKMLNSIKNNMEV